MTFRGILLALLGLAGLGGVPAHPQDPDPAAQAPATERVWVNTRSSVYHCPGTRYWGKTAAGRWMTEDEAVARGHRPAYGRSCGLVTTASDSAPPALATVRPAEPSDTIQVWVNTGSGVFHCPGTRYYGTTRAGKYLTQAAARAAGYRPAYRTPCR